MRQAKRSMVRQMCPPRDRAYYAYVTWSAQGMQMTCHRAFRDTNTAGCQAGRLQLERVTGFEPASTSLGSLGLTPWRHPQM